MVEPVSVQNQTPVQRPADMMYAPSAVRNEIEDQTSAGVRQKKALGVNDCETCKNRRYQDASDDPGVSFKSPTRLSPEAAATQVAAHEREHISRDTAKAESEDKDVISSSINIYTAICPECGRTYVSGGSAQMTTRTREDKKAADPLATTGQNMDYLI